MNKTHALFGFSFSLAMTVLGAGCAAPFEKENATNADPTATATSGLSIEERRSDLVRGTLERDGVTIGFTFSVDAKNVHHAKVWDKAGTILESTLEDGYEVT